MAGEVREGFLVRKFRVDYILVLFPHQVDTLHANSGNVLETLQV